MSASWQYLDNHGSLSAEEHEEATAPSAGIQPSPPPSPPEQLQTGATDATAKDAAPAEEEEGRLTSTSAARPPALGPHVYSAEPPPPPTAGAAREALALTAKTPMARGQPSEIWSQTEK